ncbi:MAG TPA: hypothetical protein PK339_07810 [Flavitalea sp.]|nr:hypothetical protein [Flavitalea sp.]
MKSNIFFTETKANLIGERLPAFALAAALFLSAVGAHAQGLSAPPGSYHTYAARNTVKIELGWTAAGDGETSHFILERSLDGKAFREAALVFTAEDKDMRQYAYTDRIPALAAEEQLSYQLKIVDRKGNYVYSDSITIEPDALEKGLRQMITLP